MGGLLPLLASAPLSVECARELTCERPDCFFRYTSIDLNHTSVNGTSYFQFLLEEKKSGARGVGELSSKVSITSSAARELFSACQALSLPVLAHFADSENSAYGLLDDENLTGLEQILSDYPDLVFIGHSRPFWKKVIFDEKTPFESGIRLCDYPNLYCDLSAKSGYSALTRCPEHSLPWLERYSDRVFFGCDYTRLDNAHPFALCDFLEEALSSMSLSSEAYFRICRDNAVKVFRL